MRDPFAGTTLPSNSLKSVKTDLKDVFTDLKSA